MSHTMEFRHLRCFLMLAQELHFGRAAERLAISQPPLSVAIRQLESIIGARLFDRDSKQVRLTAAGEAFRIQARALVDRAEAARVEARDVAQGMAGHLRIGLIGSMLYRGLPDWLARFQARHPRIGIELLERNSQEQIDALLLERIDIGFVQSGHLPEGLRALPVGSAPFIGCVPAGHAEAGKRRIRLARLRNDPFVLFSREVSAESYDTIIAMCHAAGFHPAVRHEVRHWLSVLAVVSRGMGVAIVPAPLQASGFRGAVFRPLDQASQVSQVFCAWHPATDHPARDALIAIVGDRPGRGEPARLRQIADQNRVATASTTR